MRLPQSIQLSGRIRFLLIFIINHFIQPLLLWGIHFWLEHPVLILSTASISGSPSGITLEPPSSIHFWLPSHNLLLLHSTLPFNSDPNTASYVYLA